MAIPKMHVVVSYYEYVVRELRSGVAIASYGNEHSAKRLVQVLVPEGVQAVVVREVRTFDSKAVPF